jgi:hypothetical protein
MNKLLGFWDPEAWLQFLADDALEDGEETVTSYELESGDRTLIYQVADEQVPNWYLRGKSEEERAAALAEHEQWMKDQEPYFVGYVRNHSHVRHKVWIENGNYVYQSDAEVAVVCSVPDYMLRNS